MIIGWRKTKILNILKRRARKKSIRPKITRNNISKKIMLEYGVFQVGPLDISFDDNNICYVLCFMYPPLLPLLPLPPPS